VSRFDTGPFRLLVPDTDILAEDPVRMGDSLGFRVIGMSASS
jgi:hypothetical protein